MDAHGEGVGRRHYLAHRHARRIGSEADDRLDLGIFREGLGARRIEHALGRFEPEIALARTLHPRRHVTGIAHEQRGAVDHHLAAAVGDNRQDRQHRGGKGIDRPLCSGRAAIECPEIGIDLVDYHLVAGADEMDYGGIDDSPVHADLHRAGIGGCGNVIEHVFVEGRHFQQHLAILGIPVERNEALGLA